MAKVSARTVLNKRALNAFAMGVADGFADMGKRFVEVVKPPDAEPFGKGLVTTPDWGVWVGGKKVDGTATKPKSARLNRTGVTLFAGEGFPGRFQELGTVKMPANPHVTPAMLHVIPDAADFIKPAVRKRLAGVR